MSSVWDDQTDDHVKELKALLLKDIYTLSILRVNHEEDTQKKLNDLEVNQLLENIYARCALRIGHEAKVEAAQKKFDDVQNKNLNCQAEIEKLNAEIEKLKAGKSLLIS